MIVKFEREDNFRIRMEDSEGGSIVTQSIEANLMYAILEKLEEIRWGIIAVENSTRNNGIF